MDTGDLLHRVLQSHRNRSLMARLLLNVMGHHKKYPVDVFELKELSLSNRAMFAAFRARCQFRCPAPLAVDDVELLDEVALGKSPACRITVQISSLPKESTSPARPVSADSQERCGNVVQFRGVEPIIGASTSAVESAASEHSQQQPDQPHFAD